MKYISTLKSPFGKTVNLQSVILFIEKRESIKEEGQQESKEDKPFYNIWFSAKRKSSEYVLVVRLLAQFDNDSSTLIKKFSSPENMTLNDSELEQAVVKQVRMQYWYVALGESSFGRAPAAVTQEVAEAVRLVVKNENKFIGFFNYNSSTKETFIAHLSFDVYNEFFEVEGQDLIVENPSFILEGTQLVIGNSAEYKWRPEDAPGDYAPLIKELLKAEVLKELGSRLGSFNVVLPFNYGNIFKGGVVTFYKQEDLFSGVVLNVAMNSDSQGKGSTIATIGRLTSLKDALQLTSISPSNLWENTSVSLGFDFVNPIVSNMYDVYARFDWRRCAYLDLNNVDIPNGKYKTIANQISTKLNVLPLTALRVIKEDIRLLRRIDKNNISLLFTHDGSVYEDKLSVGFQEYLGSAYRVIKGSTVSQADKKSFMDIFKNFRECSDAIVFSPYLYELEVQRCYTYALTTRFENLSEVEVEDYDKTLRSFGEVRDRLLEIEIELEQAVELTDVLDLQKELAEIVTTQSNLIATWERLVQVEDLESEGRLNWLKNIIPMCSGVPEAIYDDYTFYLRPRKIFKKDFHPMSKRNSEDIKTKKFPELSPLLATDIKLGKSKRESVRRLLEFIRTIRENIEPYASEHTLEIGKLTLDHRRNRDG